MHVALVSDADDIHASGKFAAYLENSTSGLSLSPDAPTYNAGKEQM